MRPGLTLSVGRIWILSQAIRLYFKPPMSGFAPGFRNLLEYERRRLLHWVYEPDRLRYWLSRVGIHR